MIRVFLRPLAPQSNPVPTRDLSQLGRSITGCPSMFRCHFCAICAPAKSKAVRVPIETRARTYPRRPKAHPYFHNGKLKHRDDPGGVGYEIVLEALACPACAARERRLLAGSEADAKPLLTLEREEATLTTR